MTRTVSLLLLVLLLGATSAMAQCPLRDGQYQLASTGITNLLYVSTDFGETFSPVNTQGQSLNPWWRLHVTPSGSTMFASTLMETWVSLNYGQDWMKLTDGPALLGTSFSGQYQAAANRTDYNFGSPAALMVSKNLGATWTQVFDSSTGFYQDAAVSGDGKVMATLPIGGNTPILVSMDNGQTWNQSSVAANTFNKVVLSYTGQYMVAAAYENNLGVFVSSDYGKTFTQAQDVPAAAWVTAAVSCTGQFQVALAKESGTMVLSADYGQTWKTPVKVPSMEQWWWVDISCSGQHITAAAADFGAIVVSNDFGVTWTTQREGLDWALLSMNKAME